MIYAVASDGGMRTQEGLPVQSESTIPGRYRLLRPRDDPEHVGAGFSPEGYLKQIIAEELFLYIGFELPVEYID